MLSIDKLRKIDPTTIDISDEEIEAIRMTFYEFGELMYEDWKEATYGSKFPIGSLTLESPRSTI